MICSAAFGRNHTLVIARLIRLHVIFLNVPFIHLKIKIKTMRVIGSYQKITNLIQKTEYEGKTYNF